MVLTVALVMAVMMVAASPAFALPKEAGPGLATAACAQFAQGPEAADCPDGQSPV